MAKIQNARSTRGLLKRFRVQDTRGFDEIDDRIYPVVDVEPRLGSLASSNHLIGTTASPVLGTSLTSWDVTSAGAGATLANLRLTRGLYLVKVHSTSNDAAFKRQDVDFINPGAVVLGRFNFMVQQGLPAYVEAYLWVDSENKGTPGFRPGVDVIQIDASTVGAIHIGWIQAVRLWSDLPDPGE